MDFGCPWLGVFGSDRAQYSNFGIRWFLPTEPKLICLYRPFSGGSQKKQSIHIIYMFGWPNVGFQEWLEGWGAPRWVT